MYEEKSAGAVLYREQSDEIKFLLIYSKRNGEWGFPKGHIEKNETETEAAVREIFEETGIKVSEKDFNRNFRFSDTYKIKGTLDSTKGRIIDKKVIYYLCAVKNIYDDTAICENEEIEKIKWMSFEEALSVLKYEKQKELLKFAKQIWLNS